MPYDFGIVGQQAAVYGGLFQLDLTPVEWLLVMVLVSSLDGSYNWTVNGNVPTQLELDEIQATLADIRFRLQGATNI